jgi:protein TonB
MAAQAQMIRVALVGSLVALAQIRFTFFQANPAMKSTLFCTLCAATCGLILVASLSQAATGNSPLRIEQTLEVHYPPALLLDGITSGDVWVMISVDETGKLTDSLVTQFTHDALAAEALRAVREWRYTPSQRDGIPVAVRTQIHLFFQATGQVISLDAAATLRRLLSFERTRPPSHPGARGLTLPSWQSAQRHRGGRKNGARLHHRREWTTADARGGEFTWPRFFHSSRCSAESVAFHASNSSGKAGGGTCGAGIYFYH